MRHSLRVGSARGLILLAAGISACAGPPPQGQRFFTGVGPVGDYTMPVQSLVERRFLTVVRQQFDFSCGSASLATLLTYHFHLPHNEAAVFLGMWRDGDREQIRKLGFSLLDMKRYLASLGFEADGYRVSLEDVDRVGVPGIALLTISGYRHFVVVKGVTETEVLVGDPSVGLRAMPRTAFQEAWNGVYFVINTELNGEALNFDSSRQWRQLPRAPLRAVFLEPLSQQSLWLTAPYYREF